MLAIADALGDAEAYLAEYRDHQPAALKRPLVADRIAQRLTAAGRADEALAPLDAAQPLPHQTPPGPGPWIDARIAALDQLERGVEAQQRALGIPITWPSSLQVISFTSTAHPIMKSGLLIASASQRQTRED
jgi:hypothetical protein